MSLVQLVDVKKHYMLGDTRVDALRGISLEVEKGEFLAIAGPSGSGKSTILNMIGCIDNPTEGKVLIDGTEVEHLSDTELTRYRRSKIGFIFQSFNLVPVLNEMENIRLPLRLAGHQADQAWVDEVVDTLGLRDRLTHRPAELSGGQQQRVAVARALASHPEIIFADEPTGNLDSRASAEVLGFMRRAVDDMGQTIVMVTHDAFAASHADRIVFLADGRIVDEMRDPTTRRVLERMQRFGD